MKKSILLLLSCILLLGCADRSDSEKCKTVNVEKTDYSDWASLLKVEKVIPLEQSSSSLVTMASKCLVRDGKVLFADFKLKSIFVFDTSGKFLFSCGKVGYSKSEHTDLWDFAVNEDENTLEILDEKGVASYDLKSGKFIKRDRRVNKSSSEYTKFMPMPNGSRLLFAADSEYSISCMLPDGNISGLRKRNGFQMTYGRFFKSDEATLVLPDYGCFTVDAYSDGKLVPKYILDFGTEALPQNMIADSYEAFSKTDNLEKYFKATTNVMENKKWLFASVVGPKHTYYTVLYNKDSGHVYAGPNDSKFAVAFVDMDDSGIYGLAYPGMLPEGSPLVPVVEACVGKNFENPVLLKMNVFEK